MSSNLDYVICPNCSALNAAQFNLRGSRSYDVSCLLCGYEYESGHYESARNLTLEEFMRSQQEEQADDEPFDAEVMLQNLRDDDGLAQGEEPDWERIEDIYIPPDLLD